MSTSERSHSWANFDGKCLTVGTGLEKYSIACVAASKREGGGGKAILVPRASWGPEHEDKETLGTQS